MSLPAWSFLYWIPSRASGSWMPVQPRAVKLSLRLPGCMARSTPSPMLLLVANNLKAPLCGEVVIDASAPRVIERSTGVRSREVKLNRLQPQAQAVW